jgi:uncharacterized protein (DUF1499 family)
MIKKNQEQISLLRAIKVRILCTVVKKNPSYFIFEITNNVMFYVNDLCIFL